MLIVLGFTIKGSSTNAILLTDSWKQDLAKPGFAVSMVYVAFAYTGWNAASYVVDEIHNPAKNLPKALIGSTLFVTVVYVFFQIALLKNATAAALQGKEEVTFIAFDKLLGTTGGKWVSAFIAIQLIATISSYLWVGVRRFCVATDGIAYRSYQPVFAQQRKRFLHQPAKTLAPNYFSVV